MGKIAVLHHSPRPTWSSYQLLKAANSLGYEPLYLNWSYLLSATHSRKPAGCSVSYRDKCIDAQLTFVRGLGRGLSAEQLIARRAILETLAKRSTVINPPDPLFIARNKFLSLLVLREKGLPVPKTYVTEDISTALKLVDELGSAVIKPIMGSLGLGSFRVNDVDSAYHVVTLLSRLNQPILIQEYIEKEGGRDLRVMVVDGRVIAAMYRLSTPLSGWKTNIARGAVPEPAEVSEEVEKVAVKATEALGLFYGGVDIAVDRKTGRLVIFEVNASPLWRGLQKVAKKDIAREIVEAALNAQRR